MLNRTLGRYGKQQYRRHEDFLYAGTIVNSAGFQFIFTQGMMNKYRAIRILFTNCEIDGAGEFVIRTSSDFGLNFATTVGDYESVISYTSSAVLGAWLAACQEFGSYGFGPFAYTGYKATWEYLIYTPGLSERTIIRVMGSTVNAIYNWGMVRRKGVNTPVNAVWFHATNGTDQMNANYRISGID